MSFHLLDNANIQSRANQISRLLDDADIPVKAAVSIVLPNVPEFLYAFRAGMWSGRTVTLVNRHLKASDIDYIVGDSESKVLIIHADYADAAAVAGRLIPEQARFSVGGDIPGFRRLAEYQRFSDLPVENPLAGRILLYTSGTTGRPKGVVYPRFPDGPPPFIGLRGQMDMIAGLVKNPTAATYLVSGPLYHGAQISYCEATALHGGRVVLMEQWDAEECLRLFHEYKVTVAFMVPTHFVRLLRLPQAVRKQYDVSSLELVLHGAAPVSVPVKRAMIDWFGPVLVEFYGGTETPATCIDSAEWLGHPGSVGRPVPGVEIQILDDSGQSCPAGSPGNVYIRPPMKIHYKNAPEKTTEAYRGEMLTIGDIGYLDEDNYLYLCDRK